MDKCLNTNDIMVYLKDWKGLIWTEIGLFVSFDIPFLGPIIFRNLVSPCLNGLCAVGKNP